MRQIKKKKFGLIITLVLFLLVSCAPGVSIFNRLPPNTTPPDLEASQLDCDDS
jgi:hypothetical protein